jgi:hypothetical protein
VVLIRLVPIHDETSADTDQLANLQLICKILTIIRKNPQKIAANHSQSRLNALPHGHFQFSISRSDPAVDGAGLCGEIDADFGDFSAIGEILGSIPLLFDLL